MSMRLEEGVDLQGRQTLPEKVKKSGPKRPVKKPATPVPPTKVNHRQSRMATVRSSRSRAQVRHGLDMAKTWYIARRIPPEGDLPEVLKPSLADCASRAGVSLIRCEELSREQGWVKQREAAHKQEEEAAHLVLIESNNRLIQQLGDQHARVRAGFLKTAIALQRSVDSSLTTQQLGASDLSSLGSAIRKAQDVADLAILGPKILQTPGPSSQAQAQVNTAVEVNVASGGWAAISAPPSPQLVAALAAVCSDPRK